MAFVTSAYSSYSGCRQYREDIALAQIEVGPEAPQVDKLRPFFNHPAFIEATVERVRDTLHTTAKTARGSVQIIYIAHSIPSAMANSCDHVSQLEEVRRLVSGALGQGSDALVYQSRSGAAGQPWLQPHILEYLRVVKERNLASAVILAPISFISGHMEVLCDLDVEARQLCNSLALPMTRAKTESVHPKFIAMIRELILERVNPQSERRALGSTGARPDI